LRLLCDEGVERQLVEALRSDGHEVSYVAEMSPGISDEEVLEVSTRDEAVLVTADKDFGELVFRQKRVHHGILLVRLHGIAPEEKGRITAVAVAEHDKQLVDAFSVVEQGRLRIRRASVD